MLLTPNNIRAELSYAYLHAVASRAGFGCEYSTRLEDGISVDAKLRIKERFSSESKLTNFTLDVQLKSTSDEPAEVNGKYSFGLRLKNYNDLRAKECQAPQLLIVLFLSTDEREWLVHSVERLICQKSAYWLSLWGAPASENTTEQTVYIPKENYLSVDNLRNLAARFSRREVIKYAP